MPRIARRVIPDIPHHIIQRGNRRQDVFFSDDDYRLYLSLLRDQCDKHGIQISAYCLMSNHVHLVVTPQAADGLRYIGEAHRRYAWHINKKMEWKGYLWQGRFASYPMDERYAYEAVRYVELNPVRAGLCTHPADYRWSSARQRINQESKHDFKIDSAPFLSIEDWGSYWREAMQKDDLAEVFVANERKQQALGLLALGTQ